MDNKDNALLARQTTGADRKQLLRELSSNIEQLCLSLSMVSPHLVEIHKADSRNATPTFDTTWFRKVSGPTQPTTQPGETAAAPSPSGSAVVSSRFFPSHSASKHTRANNTTH